MVFLQYEGRCISRGSFWGEEINKCALPGLAKCQKVGEQLFIIRAQVKNVHNWLHVGKWDFSKPKYDC